MGCMTYRRASISMTSSKCWVCWVDARSPPPQTCDVIARLLPWLVSSSTRLIQTRLCFCPSGDFTEEWYRWVGSDSPTLHVSIVRHVDSPTYRSSDTFFRTNETFFFYELGLLLAKSTDSPTNFKVSTVRQVDSLSLSLSLSRSFSLSLSVVCVCVCLCSSKFRSRWNLCAREGP